MPITPRGASLVAGAGAAIVLVATAGVAHAADPVDPGGLDPALTALADITVTVPEEMTGDATMTLVASLSGTTASCPVSIAGGGADGGVEDGGDTGSSADAGASGGEPVRTDLVQTGGFGEGPASTISAFLTLVGVGMLLGLALTRCSRF